MIDPRYDYRDIGYRHLAVHRVLSEFDPRLSDNPLISDYFIPSNVVGVNLPTYISAIDRAFDGYRKNDLTYTLPISFTMALDDINMSWVHVIRKMVIDEGNAGLFVGVYMDKILNVLNAYDSNSKESVIYRYPLGESIFHVAAYIYISESAVTSAFPMTVARSVAKKIKKAYLELEGAMGIGHENSILGMLDFQGSSLSTRIDEHATRTGGITMRSILMEDE